MIQSALSDSVAEWVPIDHGMLSGKFMGRMGFRITLLLRFLCDGEDDLAIVHNDSDSLRGFQLVIILHFRALDVKEPFRL